MTLFFLISAVLLASSETEAEYGQSARDPPDNAVDRRHGQAPDKGSGSACLPGHLEKLDLRFIPAVEAGRDVKGSRHPIKEK